jgi:DNA helicase HerA-like ATPase
MNQMATKSVQKGAEGERRGVPLAPPKQFAHIVSVAGSQAVALITRESVQAGAGGNSRVEIGQLVKIVTPHSGVIGIVSAVNLPIPNAVDSSEEFGLIELTLTGEIVTDKVSGRLCFRRGVAMLPTIGDPVLAADRHDLTRVYVQPNSDTIEVGTLYQDELVPARLLIDDLLAKHFIVVGTTGCGKSSAVTCILRRVLADFQHAHIVVLDVHNEYKSVFGQQAEAIDTTSLNLPYWLLNFQELVLALTSTDSHHDAECEILADAIVAAKRQFSELRSIRSDTTAQNFTVDTPTPFSFVDVVAWIDEQVGRLERTHVATPYRRLKNRIEALTTDRRYRFMFSGLTIDDNMAEVLGRLFRIPGNGKPITVIDLAAVPGEILDVVISVISRLAFDLAVWSDGRYPMLLVCEEAHRYAPADANGKFLPTRQALARIAKEGRKYGVSLALVTQRPSDIDPTILSQCSTAIAMRLSTERDQHVVRFNADDSALNILDLLPLLADREAIVLGQGVLMPMRIRFNDLQNDTVPDSKHRVFSTSWKNENGDFDSLSEIIAHWRAKGDTKG